MGKELPKNWTNTSVKEVSSLIRGVSYKKQDAKSLNEGNDFLILRGGNIQDGQIVNSDDQVFVDKDFVKEEQKIQKGDVVIVGSTGSKKLIGKAGIAKEDLTNISFGAFLMLIRPYPEINKGYFDYFFLSDQYREKIRVLAGGININNIRRQYIEDMSFPLPPLPEQHRIVTKLDQLFGQLELIKQSLDNIPQLLKDFRQQVLTQAVTGKLTDKWRKVNEFDKPSIKSEKNINFNVDELPHNWVLTTIENVGKVKGGKRLPKGDSLVSENTGLPYIRARDLKLGTVLTENLMYLLPETQEKIKNYTVKKNDLYITIVGAKIGDAGIIPSEMNGANLTENAAKITDLNKDVNCNYLSIWLQSSICFENMMQSIKSAAQGKLALSRIKELPFYVASIQEQQEIVNRVESLFAKADTIEIHYHTLKQKIENLPQTILHKAFKGELVPQLASDGDAKELLEEIKVLKAEIKNKSTAHKKKTIKKYKIGEDMLREVAESKETF